MTVQYREAYGLFACNGILFNHESPRRGGDVRHPQGDPRRSPRSSPAGSEQALPRQPRRPARLGLRAGVRRGDVADAPADRARRLRRRHRRDAHGARVRRASRSGSSGSTGSDYVRIDARYFRPTEVDELCGDASKAARRARLAAARPTFRELVRIMLEADLRRGRRSTPTDAVLDAEDRSRDDRRSGAGRRVMVTGGGGFLGRAVVAAAARRRARPTSSCRAARDYDLRTRDGDRRGPWPTAGPTSSSTSRPSSAASAPTARTRAASSTRTRSWASSSWSRRAWPASRSSSTIGTVCSYPKFTPVPFREDDLWNGYPEETNAPYGLAKKMLLVQGQAYREQYGFNVIHLHPGQPLRPGRQLRPRAARTSSRR